MVGSDVTLSVNFADGDVFGANSSAGGAKDGVNDITVQSNKDTNAKWIRELDQNLNPGNGNQISAVIGFSATRWVVGAAVSGRLTTNSGLTYAAGFTAPSGIYLVGASHRTDRTKGVFVTNDGHVRYTTDSGATWNTPATGQLANVTTIRDVHMERNVAGTNDNIYVVGIAAANDGFWVSTDSGANFSQTNLAAISGNIAFLATYQDTVFVIDTGGIVTFKSTDAGASFATTGFNDNTDSPAKSGFAINGTAYVRALGECRNTDEAYDGVWLFGGAANAARAAAITSASAPTESGITNWAVATGTQTAYCIVYPQSVAAVNLGYPSFIVSTSDGVSFYVRPLPLIYNNATDTTPLMFNTLSTLDDQTLIWVTPPTAGNLIIIPL
ncbi:hypothetical protein A2415_04525 [candidate division WWE3 bacterium RIFOXYC1_FULL_39_7]|uniref:Photosynthesis system II assembly factor Ycf48/Hcf136-like domain-containing protein n=1 Tax=candidate division WWE3 bacterium RIFOXYC1_FULL_39_7 TaxID=1802643 RepID=A0A1F4WG39_UNCKA|nr:MAG: hypothetical protein A2415_04525 [candidate division WWE3 bacterium RIFOXYC1_FULL_39_7]